jgi:hypothetical protein
VVLPVGSVTPVVGSSVDAERLRRAGAGGEVLVLDAADAGAEDAGQELLDVDPESWRNW